MNINICRNIYYAKESLLDFLYQNKKKLIFLMIAIIAGISLGVCVGINNFSTFTFININDKSVAAIFTNKSFFDCWFKISLHYFLLVIILLIINNFSLLFFLNYLIFAYLFFRLTVDISVLFCVFHLQIFLYIFLCYLPINLMLIALLTLLFLICSSTFACHKNKFETYPYKTIFIIIILILFLTLLFSVISKLFSKFIVIII